MVKFSTHLAIAVLISRVMTVCYQTACWVTHHVFEEMPKHMQKWKYANKANLFIKQLSHQVVSKLMTFTQQDSVVN
ncbi:hypothetical protein D3C71_1383320 [compost metagenome]